MRMAKAPQEHVDRLRVWMQFNDLLMQIDPLYNREWMDFKMDWAEDEGYTNIIKELEDEKGATPAN